MTSPGSPLLGVSAETMGGAITRNPPARVPLDESGLVTVTFLGPPVAPALTEMFAWSCEAETKVTLLIAIPAPKPTTAPDWKLVPVMLTASVSP